MALCYQAKEFYFSLARNLPNSKKIWKKNKCSNILLTSCAARALVFHTSPNMNVVNFVLAFSMRSTNEITAIFLVAFLWGNMYDFCILLESISRILSNENPREKERRLALGEGKHTKAHDFWEWVSPDIYSCQWNPGSNSEISTSKTNWKKYSGFSRICISNWDEFDENQLNCSCKTKKNKKNVLGLNLSSFSSNQLQFEMQMLEKRNTMLSICGGFVMFVDITSLKLNSN